MLRTPSGPTTFCSGGSVTLDAGSYSSYSWNTSENTESITVYGSQPYCVTVTDANGCTGTACQTVSVYSNPTPTIIGNLCNNTGILDAGSYTSYLWNTTANTETISITTAGTYSVTVTDSHGCTGTTSRSITNHSKPTPSISASGPTTFCQGGSVNLDAGSYSSYIWSTSDVTEVITATVNAAYYVTVTDANGCTGTALKIVTVNSNPTPTIFISPNPSTYCDGSSSEELYVGSYSTYSWSPSGGNTRTITIAQGNAGIYTVTVSYSTGCTGTATYDLIGTCDAPVSTSTSGITSSSATAHYTVPSCHYDFTIQTSVHNANIWTSHNTFNTTQYTFSGLTNNTSYDWEIITNCNSARTVQSSWSSIQTFMTSPRLEDEEESTISSFKLYPNPANNQITISFSSNKEEAYSIRIVDVTGRTIISSNNTSVVGNNQYEMDISKVAKGVYMVALQKGDYVSMSKIVIE